MVAQPRMWGNRAANEWKDVRSRDDKEFRGNKSRSSRLATLRMEGESTGLAGENKETGRGEKGNGLGV